MNTKTLFSLSFAAIFAIAMTTMSVSAVVATPDWIVVDSASKNQQGNLVKLTASSGGDIPRKPDAFVQDHAVSGIAWADLDTGKVIVATIHPVLGRDSHQNPDSWHVHTATLIPHGGSPDFCVASIDSTPTAGISIVGNSISINVKSDTLPVPVADIDGAVGFTIDGGYGDCTTTLGVNITGVPAGTS
jgi:hypothetical protein